MAKKSFTVDARIVLVILFSLFFALIGPCARAEEAGVRGDDGDDPQPRVQVQKDLKLVDPFVPPDVALVKDISCGVEHPQQNKALAPIFIVRCYARYEDGTEWKSPPVAMFDVEHDFWDADKKAHAEVSKAERRISEAWQKARKK